MASFLQNIFGFIPMDTTEEKEEEKRSSAVKKRSRKVDEDDEVEEGGRKRKGRDTDDSNGGNRTPTLSDSSKRQHVLLGRADTSNTEKPQSVDHHQKEEEEERPVKRFRGQNKVVDVKAPKEKKADPQQQSALLSKIPEDVVAHCLSFLGSVEDRFALQTTCKQFRRISNSDKMLAKIQVGGDRETGKNGIIREDDTPEKAAVSLSPFVNAGNLEAIYM